MTDQNNLTKWERIRSVLKGETPDRTPVALWRHFPGIDQDPEKLAEATLAFQKKYDWDLVKFTPTGTYSIADWGAETDWIPNNFGTRTITKLGVNQATDWLRLDHLDITKGSWGRQNLALQLVTRELKNQVPVLQTVFSPLTTARKLGGERIFTDIRKNPAFLKHALEIITDATIRFTIEAVKAGAHGIFFATQLASSRLLTNQEYQEFGEVYDLRVLRAVRPQLEIIFLHIHGEDIIFDLANRYPVDVVNWHDQLTEPTLELARQKTQVTLAGGVNEWQTLLKGPPSAIYSELHQAINTAGEKFILAPGCVIPQNTPEENIWSVRNLVETKLKDLTY